MILIALYRETETVTSYHFTRLRTYNWNILKGWDEDVMKWSSSLLRTEGVGNSATELTAAICRKSVIISTALSSGATKMTLLTRPRVRLTSSTTWDPWSGASTSWQTSGWLIDPRPYTIIVWGRRRLSRIFSSLPQTIQSSTGCGFKKLQQNEKWYNDNACVDQ